MPTPTPTPVQQPKRRQHRKKQNPLRKWKRNQSSLSPKPPRRNPPLLLKRRKSPVVSPLIQSSSMLQRSSGKASGDTLARKYSGSKRSSSSGKASGDTLARKYSGSKRSFDFDNEKSRDEEDDWDQKQQHQQQSTRSSPRRRTPSRERSGSRERGSQRRVSRSPGRRPEGTAAGAAAFSCDKTKQQQQPTKMVSVPAREKGVAGGAANATAAVNCRRNASPRSRSPANPTRASNENAMMAQQPQPSLSRSSSRKQEQSPYRRSPMAEVDENLIKGNNNGGANKSQKTQLQTHTQRNSSNPVVTNCVRDQLMSCRAKEKQQSEPEIVEEPKDPKGNHPTVTRSRSSRRSSRDFDHILGLNPENTPFSLPACVSKACSILEAVADLNSSSSDQTNNENGRFGQRGLNSKDAFVESEMEVKDDLTEPSLHKYVSGEDMEPQESAGSNSVGGQPWMSNWEMNSVDSTDRCWTSQSNEEVEDTSKVEGRGSTLRGGGSSSNTFAGSATGSSSKKREVEHRRQVHRGRVSGGSGKVGGSGRAYSAPVAAAASS
ncbi:uncharacterized protein A4U43_C10F11440 [Asparagus officinalis]|uniref:Uncharacterized protein n=1 Tax=Asparagus officinalis TaxID=4686 RepID=A0A5P1E2B4_ASPOF|nr:uncharacterized protein A4U43_C10F11440 [Asparagus officinalis]